MTATLDQLAATPAFILLRIDDRRVLLPQNQVSSLESVIDLKPTATLHNAAGELPFLDQMAPVFCMDSDLNLRADVPPARRLCVLLENDTQYFGLLCDHMEPVQTDRLVLSMMPECMRQPDSLVAALAILDGDVVLITTALALSHYLRLAGSSDV